MYSEALTRVVRREVVRRVEVEGAVKNVDVGVRHALLEFKGKGKPQT